MPLYEIHYRRDYDTPKDYVKIGSPSFDWRGREVFPSNPEMLGLDSLEKAKEARRVSGDLVVLWGTTKVVNSQDWLWDWEKTNPDCYSQKAIRFDNLPENTPAKID